MATYTGLMSTAIALIASGAAASASGHTTGSIHVQVGPPAVVYPAPPPPQVRPYTWGQPYPTQPHYTQPHYTQPRYAQPSYRHYGGGAYGGGYGWQGRHMRDLDRDGIPDRYDRDLDNDGRPNHRDWDRDGDGVPNRYDRRPNNPYRN